MAHFGGLISRLERLEQRYTTPKMHELVEAIFDFQDSLPERQFVLYALSIPDLTPEEQTGTSLERRDSTVRNDWFYRGALDFLPEPEMSMETLPAVLATWRAILDDLVEKLEDVEELWNNRAWPSPCWDVDWLSRWWDAMNRLLLAARDDAPDLEERKAEVRKLAYHPNIVVQPAPPEQGLWRFEKRPEAVGVSQQNVSEIRKNTAFGEILKMLSEGRGMEEIAEVSRSAKLAAIAGRKQVALKYIGLKEANLTTTLKPSRRTITYSARNPHVQMSGEEAQYVLSSAMAGEWEVTR